MNAITVFFLALVVFFTGMLLAPFAGIWFLDFQFHATLLLSGVGHVAPVALFAAIYGGLKS